MEVVLRILRSLTARGRTVVVSTHDHRLLELADSVIDMGAPAASHPVSTTGEVVLEPGEVLFCQGERGTLIFEVMDGRVQLDRAAGSEREASRVIMGPGDVFGEMAPLFEVSRSATATAISKTRLIARTVTDFRTCHGPDRLLELVGRWSTNEASHFQI